MKKRILAMLLASVMCLTVLVGCGSSQAGGENNTQTVMVVNGENIPANELAAYIYYNMNYYTTYFGMDSSYFTDADVFDSIKDSCAQQVLTLRAIQVMANENGVSLDKEDKKELDETMKQNMEYLNAETDSFKRWIAYNVKGKDDPWELYLHSMGYTSELFQKDCEIMKLEEKLIDVFYENGDIAKEFNDNYYHAKSILISDCDEDGEPLKGEDKTKAKQKAEEVLQKLKDGEEFDALWSEYNSDTAQSDDGYYFTDGDMVEEYTEGVKALDVDATSDELVYHKGYGWFIIERLPLDEDALEDTKAYLNNSGEGDTSTIKSAIGDTMVDEKLEEYVDGLEVEYTDEFDKITALNVNTYLGFVCDPLISNGSGSGSAAAE